MSAPYQNLDAPVLEALVGSERYVAPGIARKAMSRFNTGSSLRDIVADMGFEDTKDLYSVLQQAREDGLAFTRGGVNYHDNLVSDEEHYAVVKNALFGSKEYARDELRADTGMNPTMRDVDSILEFYDVNEQDYLSFRNKLAEQDYDGANQMGEEILGDDWETIKNDAVQTALKNGGVLPEGYANKKNFTLIELLVVVSIISILAAMLLPALSKARSKAHEITCVNNQKQLYTGVFMYDDDYNHLPMVMDGTEQTATPKIHSGSEGKFGLGLMYPDHLSENKTLFDPEANFYTLEGPAGWDDWGTGNVISSYFWRQQDQTDDSPTRLDRLAELAILWDFNRAKFLVDPGRWNDHPNRVVITKGDGSVRGYPDKDHVDSSDGTDGDVDKIVDNMDAMVE